MTARYATIYCRASNGVIVVLKCDDFRVHTFCATNEVKPGLYLDDDNDGGLDSGTVEAAQSGPLQSGCEDQLEIQLSEEAVVELFKIQLQMQMAEQLAEIQGWVIELVNHVKLAFADFHVIQLLRRKKKIKKALPFTKWNLMGGGFSSLRCGCVSVPCSFSQPRVTIYFEVLDSAGRKDC
ncbi:hypothetical protein TEA_020946 [Camellia sinensis var. sinensis]|uniref:Uncharacterized protein n=1 Tax=Camellia sinensis var. sinensis TaxID=542762 RepID=A0A4S4ESM0_CAMSN|nr:hypothetical protein TEA_020946 [Camellia sinensis var. sinensis]